MSLVDNLRQISEFKGVQTLRYVLASINVLRETGDYTARKDFLDDSLVIIESKYLEQAFYKELIEHIKQPHTNFNDAMDQIEKGLPNSHIQHKESVGQDSRVFNICTKYLKDQDMEWLFQQIGSESLRILLTHTICIRKFGENYWQIWGTRLDGYFDELKKKVREFQGNRKFIQKKQKSNAAKGYQRNIKQYFKTYVNKNHMLYCLHSNGEYSYFRKSKIHKFSEDLKKLEADSELLPDDKKARMKDIGKQFSNQIFDEYHIQHKESREAFYVEAVKFIQNYGKVDVHKLAMNFCKMPSEFFQVKQEYEEFIKDEHNENKQGLIPKMLSVLVKLDTPASKVKKFLEQFLKKCIPPTLFGPNNRLKLIKSIGRLTVMKKYEMITFEEVIKQMDFREIKWLSRQITKKNKGSVVAENNEYIRQLLYYLFNMFAIQLIRANFYVTEKHHEHNKLFFYCKPVWYMLVRLSMINLAAMNLEKLDMNEFNDTGKKDKELMFQKKNDLLERKPCAKLRLVPKSDSVRPIMTFYKKFRDDKKKKLMRVGNYLQNAKVVLRTLKRALADRQGFAVFDNYQIFNKFSTYKSNWMKEGSPEVFYGTMDIQKCYDSVDLNVLFDLLKKEDIFKDFYLINDFIKIIRNRRYVFRKKKGILSEKLKMNNLFIMKGRDAAIPLQKLNDIRNYTLDEVTKYNKTIFLDRPRKRVVSKDGLMDNITNVCKNCVIRFGNQIFKLKCGLPQGLSISSVLSSFYYSCMERLALSSIYDSTVFSCEKDLIMRLTDDYLLISKDQDKVKRIVDSLNQQSHKYNYSFNKQKMTFNFEHMNFKPSEEQVKVCRWIGKVIDTNQLEIEHIQILDEKQAFFTVSTNISYLEKYPAQVIKAKLKSFILNHNLFALNPNVNSKEKIFEILQKIVHSAYLKIKTYFSRILSDDAVAQRRKGSEKHEYFIGKKIYEALIDCTLAVYSLFEENQYEPIMPSLERKKKGDTKKNHKSNQKELKKELFELIKNTFLNLMKTEQNTKSKKKLYVCLKYIMKERNFEHWVNKNDDMLILD